MVSGPFTYRYIGSCLGPKRLFPFVCLLFSMSLAAQGFVVDRYQAHIILDQAGYFDVVENYDITFTSPKHGIFRVIRTQYDLVDQNGNRSERKIKIRKVKVPGHKFEADPIFFEKVSNNFQIKIGDKDKTVMGPEHYQIKYRVYNAFLYGDGQIRFYWNVKPDGWRAPFNQIDFTVQLPAGVTPSTDDIFVYAGPQGTTQASDQFDVSLSDGAFSVKSREGFRSGIGESVTVLINLPQGSVAETKPWWPFWTDYGWTLILAAMLLAFYWVWNRFGKDDRVVATTSYYPPQGIDPAMAGFLIDDRADTPDLVSLIPCWGSRGIIKVTQIPKEGWFGKEDTKLTRLRPLPMNAPDYEETMFEGLFGKSPGTGEKEVLISSLKDSFYTTMAEAKKQLKRKAQIYYDPKAKQVQGYTIIGIFLMGMILFFGFLFLWGIIAAVAVVPVVIFLIFMSFYLVRKNAKGNAMLTELKGFKNFIRIAEENKLKMLLRDSPSYFETTMAYALAFGLFERWAKKFEALDVQPPSWYTSTAGFYTMHNFAHSFSDTISTTQSTMVSAPSSSGSSGGGSSGGGFGGGGGGSW